jgi:hypothetical protein
MTETPAAGADLENPPAEIVPDYTRLGFRDLQRLCKARKLPGDGKTPELIERLRAYDAQNGLEVNVDLPEVDLLAEDEDDTPAQEQPPADVAAASAPSAGGAGPTTNLPPAVPASGTTTAAPAQVDNFRLMGAPAVTVTGAPDEPSGLPRATTQTGKPDLSVHDGLVKVGEGHGAAEVRAFRREYTHGPREVTDSDHFGYIADTHAAAQAAGLATKGGITVGERVGFGADADGRRTVIYQVPIKRQK